MKKSKNVFIVSESGQCAKVYLDLKNNYIRGMQRGSIGFLRKMGWDIEKVKKLSLNDFKRERIFGNEG